MSVKTMPMTYPKISIVTPSLNQAQFLEAAIRSVLSQNYPNLEYIVIDGGSTDGSVEIIRRYASRLAYWVSEPDNGHYDAINRGFARSTGELMAWLNSDDLHFPWALKTVASIMTAWPQVEWLTTLERGKWDWHGFCLQCYPLPGYARAAFLDGAYLPAMTAKAWGCIQQESTFWRRSLWQKIGGRIPTTYALAADFDLWAHCYRHADLYGTRSPLAGFRCQQQQRSHHIEHYVAEARDALDKMRRAVNWMPDRQRTMITRWKLHRIPLLQPLLASRCSYTGKQVYRKHPQTSEGAWDIKEYRFV